MSPNSAARAARFIFRPSAASAGGVCVRAHRIPNAAAAYRRHFSVPTRRSFLVDTIALVRGMEAHGIESKHAEAIASAITDSLEIVAESFVSKGEMQKMIQDANLSKFKSEVRTSQDHPFSLLLRATEKLQGDIDLLYGWIHLELAKQNAETTKQIAEVGDRIAEASARITKQIAEASDRIIEANDQITKQITKQITEANGRITKQFAEAFDRLPRLTG